MTEAQPRPIPTPGTVEDGYRFMGGDWQDAKNWASVEEAPKQAATEIHVGGGARPIPTPGTVEDGYRFMGGDWQDAKNWVPAENHERTWGDYAKGVGRSVEQGLTFGFGDEANALARHYVGGEEYDKALADERAKLAAFRETNPYSAYGSEIASGAAIPMGAAGNLIKGGAKAGEAMLAGAKAGALQGGLYGFGAGEGGAVERAKEAVPSAIAGAGVGAVGGAYPHGMKYAVPAGAAVGAGLGGAYGAATGGPDAALKDAALGALGGAGAPLAFKTLGLAGEMGALVGQMPKAIYKGLRTIADSDYAKREAESQGLKSVVQKIEDTGISPEKIAENFGGGAQNTDVKFNVLDAARQAAEDAKRTGADDPLRRMARSSVSTGDEASARAAETMEQREADRGDRLRALFEDMSGGKNVESEKSRLDDIISGHAAAAYRAANDAAQPFKIMEDVKKFIRGYDPRTGTFDKNDNLKEVLRTKSDTANKIRQALRLITERNERVPKPGDETVETVLTPEEQDLLKGGDVPENFKQTVMKLRESEAEAAPPPQKSIGQRIVSAVKGVVGKGGEEAAPAAETAAAEEAPKKVKLPISTLPQYKAVRETLSDMIKASKTSTGENTSLTRHLTRLYNTLNHENGAVMTANPLQKAADMIYHKAASSKDLIDLGASLPLKAGAEQREALAKFDTLTEPQKDAYRIGVLQKYVDSVNNIPKESYRTASQFDFPAAEAIVRRLFRLEQANRILNNIRRETIASKNYANAFKGSRTAPLEADLERSGLLPKFLGNLVTLNFSGAKDAAVDALASRYKMQKAGAIADLLSSTDPETAKRIIDALQASSAGKARQVANKEALVKALMGATTQGATIPQRGYLVDAISGNRGQ